MVSTSLPLRQPFQSLKLLRDRLKPQQTRVKTPTLLQMEAVECGAAALGIVLGYYGRIVPLPELRRECGVSRDGSKASNLLKAARNYGLQAKGFKHELEQLVALKPPFIVFWNFNHFLVVEGFSSQKVFLNDPATGPRSVSRQEFDEGYTGIVLVMEPAAEFEAGGRKPSLAIALWERLQGATGALAYCLLAGFLLTIVNLAVPVFNQIFVDEVLIQGREQWVRPLILGIILTTILQGVFTLLRLRYLRRLKVKLSIGMSSRFLWHLLRLPMSFYAQRFAGEITNRSSLNDEVADVLSGRLATTAIDAVMVVFYTVVMFQYDIVLTLIGILLAAVNVITLQVISRQRVDANQRLMQEYGKAAGVSIAALQSIETLKASGTESDFFARWAGYYTKAANSQQQLGITNQIFSVLPTLLMALSSMALLVVGGWRVMDGYLSIGMLIAFQALMQSFMQPVNNLVSFGSTLQELEGNLVRLDDVLCNPTDCQLEARNQTIASIIPAETIPAETIPAETIPAEDVPAQNSFTAQTAVLPVSRLQGCIELRNVSFGYSRLEPPLIENFSLTIQPGQRVALVGGSGSGKSTIAKLISGLYQPWSGEIYFDGKLREQIPYSILTNSIAVVEQEILLFGGTVRNNLTLWDTTIPDHNLTRACRDAAIEDILLSMPGGYDAELLEGAANLSGGQRQRLEIARALVNNPAILIMDEATSALDAETEKKIDENLRRRGCTGLIVAHRLSTIRDCDEIIVMEHGKVVQRGAHDDLWKKNGVYAQLIRTEGETL